MIVSVEELANFTHKSCLLHLVKLSSISFSTSDGSMSLPNARHADCISGNLGQYLKVIRLFRDKQRGQSLLLFFQFGFNSEIGEIDKNE